MDGEGTYEAIVIKRERILAANPHLRTRITGEAERPKPVWRPVESRPMHYVAPTLGGIIEVVAYQADLAPSTVRGSLRGRKIVNARFAIANLAAEFLPGLSDRAIEDAMLRGEGMANWYIQRHADRLALFPDYARFFSRCRAAFLTGRK